MSATCKCYYSPQVSYSLIIYFFKAETSLPSIQDLFGTATDSQIAAGINSLVDAADSLIANSDNAADAVLTTPTKRKAPEDFNKQPPAGPVKRPPPIPRSPAIKFDGVVRKLDFSHQQACPSPAVFHCLERLTGMPDELPELQSLVSLLKGDRYALRLVDLVSVFLQDAVLSSTAELRNQAIRHLLLICFSYASNDDHRKLLHKALEIPNNITKDSEKLAALKPRNLFGYQWDSSANQARAVQIMRGLRLLFGSTAATPMIFWREEFAYQTVEECVAGANRL